MAFSFAQPSNPTFGSSGFAGATQATSNAQVQTGPDLPSIHTEVSLRSTEGLFSALTYRQRLAFQALNGDAKVRLLPSAWPSDNPPPPTSTLLSIASGRGLLAAAGPDSVVVASTETVRAAFSAEGDVKNKPFTPQLTLPIGTRISQVAFSADESALILSAEHGGGLAIYETQNLLQGSTSSAFELATGGAALRALAPNPSTANAHLLAIVTTNGDLMVADMKTRQFVNTANGQVLKSGVSCVSWSKQGKQLMAGLGDGSAAQMTPEGVGKAEIPKPQDVGSGSHGTFSPQAAIHVY